jgi:hypothetical protein
MIGEDANGREPIVYRIDANDTIVSVNAAWREFAHANDAPLVAEHAVGSSLWDSITGAETALLWREVMTRAREGAAPSFPYRCDSPGRRRHLQMRLIGLPDGGIEFVSTLRTEDQRDPVALLLGNGPRPGTPIRSCSWCRRFDADGFVEVEEAIIRLGLLENAPPPVTHVLCAQCATAVREAAGLTG